MIRLIRSVVTIGIFVVAANHVALAETRPGAAAAQKNGASSAQSAAKRTTPPPKGSGATNAVVKSKSNITNN